jgi:hypothetical protein
MHAVSAKRLPPHVAALSFALLVVASTASLPVVASAARRPLLRHTSPAPQARSCNPINMQYGRTVTGLTISSHVEAPSCGTATLVARSYVVKAELPTRTDVTAGLYARRGTTSAAHTWTVVCTLAGRGLVLTVDFQEHDTEA